MKNALLMLVAGDVKLLLTIELVYFLDGAVASGLLGFEDGADAISSDVNVSVTSFLLSL
jgi:hypothetical protein